VVEWPIRAVFPNRSDLDSGLANYSIRFFLRISLFEAMVEWPWTTSMGQAVVAVHILRSKLMVSLQICHFDAYTPPMGTGS
jgi:hypothetical protein